MGGSKLSLVVSVDTMQLEKKYEQISNMKQ